MFWTQEHYEQHLVLLELSFMWVSIKKLLKHVKLK
jgi:hypothetical protein